MERTSAVRFAGRIASGLFLSRSRPSNIAAFHLGRSGSRLLGDLLKQNSSFFWDGELLSPGRLKDISSRWPLITKNPYTLLRLRMMVAGRTSYGFETQPTQVENLEIPLESYLVRLEELGFNRFILLRRRNQLRRIVSMLVARETSQWHLRQGEQPKRVQIHLDVDRLLLSRGRDTEPRPLVEHIQRDEASLRELEELLGQRSLLKLTYEDDLAIGAAETYRRVCEFGQTRSGPVQITFERTNPYPLSDVVTNWPDVERALSGTPYEWMLE